MLSWDWDYLEHKDKFLVNYINNGEYKNDIEPSTNGVKTRKENLDYQYFKSWIGEESDNVVYPIIKEKFKEFVKEILAKAEKDNVAIKDITGEYIEGETEEEKEEIEKEKEEKIEDFAKWLFEKYKADEQRYKVRIYFIAELNSNDELIYNDNTVIESVVIEDKVGGWDFYKHEIFIEKDGDIEDYDKANGDSEADTGGLLLDLLFPLFNFLADTILNCLGKIMTGDLAIIRDPEAPANIANAVTYPVDTTPFVLSKNTFRVIYSPEEIFSGKIPLLSIDFISGKFMYDEDGNKLEPEDYIKNPDSGWTAIRGVIASWYKALRMIAIIGFLSVLIYTGIKIILSSNAKDKAKYKEWIINWFIGIAILFFMHYMMSFIISVTGEFSGALNASSKDIKMVEEGNGNLLCYTNLMGLVRFMVQSNNGWQKIGYEVMYIALIVYTFKFTFIYLKRVLNMAFLTLIAPIVALTYPIDKLNDGNAQGFEMWLKEYIFNALLQPMHYIMYYVLLSSAIGLAAKNPLYAIVVLAFMTEAERLLKKIFGFDKAGGGTVGGMAGAFAAGALASNVKNIAKLAGKAGVGNGGNSGGGNNKNPLDNPKPTQDKDFSEFDDPNSDQPQLGDGQEERQQMLDAYDENYNSDEWDPQEREAMAREAEQPDGMDYTDEEYAQILRDSGYDEDQIAQMTQQQSEQQQEPEPEPEPEPPQQPQLPQQADSGEPVREMAQKKKQGKFKKGAKALGKRLLKPAWDLDHTAGHNFKRIARGVAKGALGVGLGVTAAAVQAGISITDGKYNPLEGIATFGAGFAGGKGIVNGIGKGIGGMVDTYRDGASTGDKKALMERAQARFADREDVIAFNKKEFAADPEAAMERQRDNYLPNGVSDLKEMKSCMKYANTLTASGMSVEAADRRSALVANFKKQLQDQGQAGAVYDKKKQKEYIDAMVKQAAPEDAAKIKGRYQNLFNAAQAFDKAQG